MSRQAFGLFKKAANNKGCVQQDLTRWIFYMIVLVLTFNISLRTTWQLLGSSALLAEYGLVLAPVSKVSREAITETSGVLANAAPRAIASFGAAVPAEDVRSRGAFLLGTIRAAISDVALATDVFLRVPWRDVGRALQGRERLERQADSASGAIVGTLRAFAGLAVVILEAPAFSCLAIAKSLVGAFHEGMSLVFPFHCLGRPSGTLGTSPQGAVMSCPCRVPIGAVVTGAFVCFISKDEVRNGNEATVKCEYHRILRALPLTPQDPFFEHPLGQYAPTVATIAASTRKIFVIALSASKI